MLRLNKNKQRGQIIIFMMFAIIPIVLLMAYIFNGGYVVAQKVRLQNATDTSALMEASWTARSLNIMSMNNTALTQSLAITSSGWALEKPLMDAGLNAGLVAGWYVGRMFLVAKIPCPWCAVLAVLVHAALVVYLERKVMKPLQKLQKELLRAMHNEEDTGFAKAATSFARMNKILDEKFPNKIEEYSDELLAANYYGEASLIRYTAWHPIEMERGDAGMPVVEQSFAKALEGVGDAIKSVGTNTDSSAIGAGTGNALDEALATIKDVRDVYHAGLHGTITNPYSLNPYDSYTALLPFNYFGNFKAQGYPAGTGPMNAARDELVTRFETIYYDLELFLKGTVLGNVLDKVLGVFGPNKSWNFIRKAVKKVVNTLFSPLIATGYDNQKTDPEDFKKRLENVYRWSTYYGETHYSNSWRVLEGTIPVGPWNIHVPPRAWRGIIPGIYHGRDIKNLGAGVSFDQDAIEDEINDAFDEAKNNEIQDCYNKIISDRILEYYEEKRLAKDLVWRNANPKPVYTTGPNQGNTIPQNVYRQLNGAEKLREEDRADRDVRAQCTKEYEDDREDKEEDNAAPPDDNPTEDTSGDAHGDDDFSQTHGDGTTKGGSWKSPKGMQKYLMMINWLFEPSYKVIEQGFPLDAALFAFISDDLLGSGRNEPEPNYWCGKPLKNEGFLCTNDTPMYAVRGQRLIPEFASDILNKFNLDLNSLPAAVQKNYAADRDDWSLVVATTAPIGLPLYEGAYGHIPTEMSAIAQVEVYNAQWFDLFTQTWKSKMVPLELLDDADHWNGLNSIFHSGHGYPFANMLEAATDPDERVLNH